MTYLSDIKLTSDFFLSLIPQAMTKIIHAEGGSPKTQPQCQPSQQRTYLYFVND